jgi:hypothetical protein
MGSCEKIHIAPINLNYCQQGSRLKILCAISSWSRMVDLPPSSKMIRNPLVK